MRKYQFALFYTVFAFGVASCGGGQSSGGNQTSVAPDVTAPIITFSPDSLAVTGGQTANSVLTFSDNVGITTGPNVSCTNGGAFANDVFTAPSVQAATTSICTAQVSDAAGNSSSATLTVSIEPANQAPEAMASADKTDIDEGQPFILDATESTDPDNDALTYEWSQLSGPNIEIADPTLSIQNLNAVEITEDVTAQFQVSVTDGTLTSTATVDVNIVNIFQSPRRVDTLAQSGLAVPTLRQAVVFEPSETPVFLESTLDSAILMGQSGLADNSMDITMLVSQAGSLALSMPSVATFLNEFSRPLIYRLRPSARFSGTELIYVAEESNNTVTSYERTSLEAYEEQDQFSIQAPCEINDQGERFLKIGQRGLGLTLLQADGTSQVINDGSSYCAIFTARDPVENDFDLAGTFFRPRVPSFIAVDTENNTLNLFRQQETNAELLGVLGQATYGLMQQVPIDFAGATDLRFVTAFVEFSEPRAMYMLFTNDEHDGEHRLITVGLDSKREIFQQTLSWPKGIPTDMTIRERGSSERDIFIITSTSPDAVIFTIRDPNDQTAVPDPASLSFLEIGLGAELVTDVYISFPERREIRRVNF